MPTASTNCIVCMIGDVTAGSAGDGTGSCNESIDPYSYETTFERYVWEVAPVSGQDDIYTIKMPSRESD